MPTSQVQAMHILNAVVGIMDIVAPFLVAAFITELQGLASLSKTEVQLHFGMRKAVQLEFLQAVGIVLAAVVSGNLGTAYI